MTNSKNILVAPLNWGLGHATRCIPIIKALIEHDFTPLIASDGEALALLQKEFPNLKSIELPSYNIRYTKHGAFLKWKFILNSPKLLYAVYQERQLIAALIKQHNISGIISDNRFGVRHHSITSVYITHQVNVLSGYSTKLNSWLHQCIIAKFDECWIPDTPNNSALSGKLGQPNNKTLNLKHIGILSRFKKTEAAICYDYLILLSGPEPQRTIL
ncbi:MAG: glycosyltransferase, partial [Flavobacteriaceae bacterium]